MSSRSSSVSCRQSGHSERWRSTRSRSAGGSSPRRYGTRSVSGCVAISALLHRLLQGRERTVQVDAHGRLGALEYLGDVVRRHVLLHPEQHGGPLTRGQSIHRGAQVLHCSLVGELVDGVGDGRRLPVEDRLTLVVIIARPQLPPAILPFVVEAKVDQDPVEPGGELRPAAEAPGRLVKADEGLLRDVARVLVVAQDGPSEAVRPLLVARHQEVERRLVPLGHALAERLVGWLHPAVVLSAPTWSLPALGPQASPYCRTLRASSR